LQGDVLEWIFVLLDDRFTRVLVGIDVLDLAKDLPGLLGTLVVLERDGLILVLHRIVPSNDGISLSVEGVVGLEDLSLEKISFL
jgi:hypothetical protein